MKAKALLNLLPLAAVVIVGWLYVSSLWQQSQSGRSGNDLPSPAPGLLPRTQSELATVINVHDGDTITVKLGWQKVKVRLCGIDAPELSQPFGAQSRDHLRALLASAGTQVILYGNETDRYGRKVAELYVPAHNPQQTEEEKLLNEEQLLAGRLMSMRNMLVDARMGVVSPRWRQLPRGKSWVCGVTRLL